MEYTPTPIPPESDRKHRKQVLSIEPNLGSVHVCEGCERIHLQLGTAHVTMDLAAFLCLAGLIDRATANFELWAESSHRHAW